MSQSYGEIPVQGVICETDGPHVWGSWTAGYWINERIRGCCWGTWAYFPGPGVDHASTNSHLRVERIAEHGAEEPYTFWCGAWDDWRGYDRNVRTRAGWQEIWEKYSCAERGPHVAAVPDWYVLGSRKKSHSTAEHWLKLEDCCWRDWRLTPVGPRRRTDLARYGWDVYQPISGYSHYSPELVASNFSLPVLGEPEIRTNRR